MHQEQPIPYPFRISRMSRFLDLQQDPAGIRDTCRIVALRFVEDRGGFEGILFYPDLKADWRTMGKLMLSTSAVGCIIMFCLFATVGSLRSMKSLSLSRNYFLTEKTFFYPVSILRLSVLDEIEDEEEIESFQRIVKNYLSSKFLDCTGKECHFERSRAEVESLIREVLPPVTPTEFEREVQQLLSKIPGGSLIAVGDYADVVLQNSYWAKAGPLVVKELIFLDCVYNYYHSQKSILNDEDYNELKDSLTWEGSVAASIRGNEAKFISAVASANR